MAKQEAKKKRKRWLTILPTSHFKVKEIGESFVAEPSSLVGKTVTMNVMDLTRDPKKQNLKITFMIKEVKDNRAITEIKRYQMLPSSVRRLMHPGKSKIDDSFIAETKDNIKVRIKPVLITRSKTTRGVLSKLKHESEKFLRDNLKKVNYDELINNVLDSKIQVSLRNHVKKIYPLAGCHIRMLEKSG